MNELLLSLIEPLEQELQTQILKRFKVLQLEGADPLDLLCQTLQDFPRLESYPPNWWLDPHLCRWWLCLSVDWKASDEVAWQIQAIARTLELSGSYLWDFKEQSRDASVTEVLEHASHWLRGLEHALLLLETGGDEYVALVAHHDRLERVVILLEQVGISSSLI